MSFDPYAAIGMAGVVVVTVAYFANQHGALSSEDWRFPFANLVGALLILASFWDAWNLPAAVIEVVWAAVSLYGLTRHSWR
jgi:hypothetical protein